MDEDDAFLARALFSDKTFAEIEQQARALPSFGKTIRLLSAVNTREEVSLIAGEVNSRSRRGTLPTPSSWPFPRSTNTARSWKRSFTDYGIPYNRALGRQLSTSPVATAVVSLLRACQEDFSGPSLLRVFSSPFLKFGENRTIAPALDRFMRDRRITGGKEKLLAALRLPSALMKAAVDMLTGPLKDLFAALEPFSSQDTAPLAVWMERLAGSLPGQASARGCCSSRPAEHQPPGVQETERDARLACAAPASSSLNIATPSANGSSC